VLAREIEKIGIPAVLITALVPVAKTFGAPRIVRGIGITNPTGNPSVRRNEELSLRRQIVFLALQKLTEESD